MFSTNAKLNNNNYFICVFYFIFPLLLSISCSCVMAAKYPGYIKISGYDCSTYEYILYHEDYGKYYRAKISDQYLQQHTVHIMTDKGREMQTYSRTSLNRLTGNQSDFRIYSPDDLAYPDYRVTRLYFRIKDIQQFIPSLPRSAECILTQNPGSCSTYSAKKIEIGKTKAHPTPQPIYAKGSDPAVLIVNPKLSSIPPIDKINFSSNVYGELATAANTFSNTAVEINNTNNMTIKDGITVNSRCNIKGKIAIYIQDELTTDIINHGTIYGTDKGIYNFWRITGNFENHGTVKGDSSFYDAISAAATYEIHNYSGATIEGNIHTVAKKIENGGIIKGDIKVYSNTTIENSLSGKIQCSTIEWPLSGKLLALNNYGEISVTDHISVNNGFSNYGVFSAKKFDLYSAGLFQNLTKAKFECTDPISANSMQIDNQGSVALQSCSSIADYHGKNTSELVLTLPSSEPSKPLLKVKNGARFDAGAKIILATKQSLSYLTSPKGITILHAGNLAGAGVNKPEDLLFTRIYDTAYNIIKAGGSLSSSSVLINITDANITSTDITAKLQIASIPALNIPRGLLKVQNSLLNNTISSFKQKEVITTADPVGYYTYINNNIEIGTKNKYIYDIDYRYDPAVLIINPDLSALPTINKINVMSNVATKQEEDKIAIFINNTNNMHITGGIEINSGVEIISYCAIAFGDKVTTDLTNRGIITSSAKASGKTSGDRAIYKFYNVTGKFQNYGTVHSDGCSFFDDYDKASAATYEIHNHLGATIKGHIATVGKRIENSGIIKGDIDTYYSKITIENRSSGEIHSSTINWHKHGQLTLNNHGEIIVSNNISVNNGFSNYGVFSAKKFDSDSTGLFQNLTRAKFECTDPISANSMQIDNQGSVALQSCSTINRYHGYNTSELVLTLPSSEPSKPLLKVKNDANFDAGAKIILATKQSLSYLTSKKRITILQAGNLAGAGVNKPADLLFTRVYDANYKTTNIISGSILFSIENIHKDNNNIIANLELVTTHSLGMSNANMQGKLIDSLLSKKIVSGLQTQAIKNPITTSNPPYQAKYTKDGKTVDIGITDSNQTPQTIYAKGSAPAVLIINPNLSSVPTIDKINFRSNVYGALSGSSNFDNTAVEITHTSSANIKDGIEVNASCTIKGYRTIDIQDKLTTDIINRGTIYGIYIGIYNVWRISGGNFENYGTVHGDRYSVYDYRLQAETYEIHNHFGATIESEIFTVGKRIENSGIIKGDINTYYSNITIENSLSGKIQSSTINWHAHGQLTLNNYGEITVTKNISVNGGFNNWGVFSAKEFDSDSTGLFQNLTRAKFECIDPISNNNIQIDNQGSVALQSCSSINRYHGYNTSELVLTLPAGTAKPANPLLTVAGNARFDAGAKIILAATQSLSYLASPQDITILHASHLTGSGVDNPEDLLFTRVYDANYKTTNIISGSILFSIENVYKDNNNIIANLELVTTHSLGMSNTNMQGKLIDSLLSKKIVSGSQTQAIKNPITTSNPPYLARYTNDGKIVDIGITAQNNLKARSIYAKGSAPAVLIIHSGLVSQPVIDKITFKSKKIYGQEKGTHNFNKTAVEINNTNNITIKDGITVNYRCHIKGYTAIDIQDELTTNFTNRGRISGTDKAIKDFSRITGNFENHGTVKGAYSFHDHTSAVATYEIHNYSGATLKAVFIQ